LFAWWQESSEDSELRAVIAASITDTRFKPVCYDLSDSDSSDTDVLEIPDDKEASQCSSGRTALVPDGANDHTKPSHGTSSMSASNKPSTETALCKDTRDSGVTGNCVGGLHEATEVESLVSNEDSQVSTAQQTTGSWKDFLGSESGNS